VEKIKGGGGGGLNRKFGLNLQKMLGGGGGVKSEKSRKKTYFQCEV
jgi:hypothetical protein